MGLGELPPFELYYPSLDKQKIQELIKNGLSEIEQPGDATGWMDLIRTLRQPQNLWKIDFIEPGDILEHVNAVIRESEITLYGDKRTLKLKEGYSAKIYQEIAFHTIRAHMRSEEGDVEMAADMFNELFEKWYDDLIPIRQSNLLIHCCLSSLCCMNFERSYECLQKHWTLLKYSNESERTGLGIWDNQVILQMIYWFFLKNVVDFRNFYAIKSKLKYASDLFCHKKVPMLNFLSYDIAWVVSFCGLPFYNHARKLMPTLPEYEKRDVTPRNLDIPVIFDSGREFTDHSRDSLSAKEKYYYDQYNIETSQEYYAIDGDLADNFLFSYYSYEHDYEEDSTNKLNLANFLHEYLDPTKYNSLLEAGCGKLPLLLEPNVKRVCMDISEQVHKELTLSGVGCIHQSVVSYLYHTNENFDVCFASDLLQIFNQSAVEMFLVSCKKKCKYVVALIDTREDVRPDIVSYANTKHKAIVHKTVLSHEKWISLFSKYFSEIQHRKSGPWLYILGNSN